MVYGSWLTVHDYDAGRAMDGEISGRDGFY